jgi:hypothetical protein
MTEETAIQCPAKIPWDFPDSHLAMLGSAIPLLVVDVSTHV